MIMTSIVHSPINRRLADGVRWFASIALSALLLCIHVTVVAQPRWSLDWGKPYKADPPGDILGFIHVDPTYSYAIRAKLPKLKGSSKDQQVALERYDNKLNFVKSSPIAMNYKGDGPFSYIKMGTKNQIRSTWQWCSQMGKYSIQPSAKR